MNTSVVVTKSFEEKMKDRIKDSIGDLITDEQLTKLIEKSMHEVFFTSTFTPDPRGSYYDKVETKPFIYTLTKTLLTERMNVMIASYINDHANEVSKIIEEVVEKGAGDIFMNAITRQFDVPLSMLQANVSNLLYTNQNQSR